MKQALLKSLKLLKYDMLSEGKFILILMAFPIYFNIVFIKTSFLQQDHIGFLFFTILLFYIFSMIVLIRLVYRIYLSLFSPYSYLIHSIPIGIDYILISKILFLFVFFFIFINLHIISFDIFVGNFKLWSIIFNLDFFISELCIIIYGITILLFIASIVNWYVSSFKIILIVIIGIITLFAEVRISFAILYNFQSVYLLPYAFNYIKLVLIVFSIMHYFIARYFISNRS